MIPKFKYIQLIIKDKIAKIILNRPEKRNAMNSDVLREIDSSLDFILSERRNKDSEVRVILFEGAGDHFTGGADIKEMRNLDPTKAFEFSRLGQYIGKKLERFPIPIIAVIQGYCVGGGVELTSACDMRIASKDALFGQPEINIGIVTGWGSSQRLPRIVGISKAKELMYSGKIITADEACKIGLIDMVVPRNKLESTALDIAEQIKQKPAAAIAAAKETVLQASLMSLDDGLEFERKSFGALFGTHDQKEAMTAFLEKRKSHFSDTIDDFFNLDRYPWKGSVQKEKRVLGELPFQGNPKSEDSIKNPFLSLMDNNFSIPANPLLEQLYTMQKMSYDLVQKQYEMIFGHLMDFSKFIPKSLQ